MIILQYSAHEPAIIPRASTVLRRGPKGPSVRYKANTAASKSQTGSKTPPAPNNAAKTLLLSETHEQTPSFIPLVLRHQSFSKSFGLGSPMPSSLMANMQSDSGRHGES